MRVFDLMKEPLERMNSFEIDFAWRELEKRTFKNTKVLQRIKELQKETDRRRLGEIKSWMKQSAGKITEN